MFERIHHVAFVVRDIEQSMEQFETNFGMELESRDQMSGAFQMDVALYRAGNNIVELIEPLSDEGWTARVLEEQGEGFFHIAYQVDDIEKRVAELEEKGIRCKDDEPQEGYNWWVVTLNEEDTLVPMQLVETYD